MKDFFTAILFCFPRNERKGERNERGREGEGERERGREERRERTQDLRFRDRS